MDINNIKAFVSVAETGSFSNAAERLYVTQPAVSKRIAGLESTLSTKLFDRIGRRIILTEAGKTILPKCRLILDTLNDTATSIHNLSGEVSGRLTLGTSHHIGLHHIPPVLRQYVQRYPNVQLDIHFLSSEQVCEKVENADLELGIITLPIEVPEKLTVNSLWKDPMQLVVNSEHPIAQQTTCTLDAFTRANAILPERSTFTYSIIDREFIKRGIELKAAYATNYLQTIKMMVAIGLGWSVLPETLIDDELHIIHIPQVSFSRTLGTVRHKQRTLSNATLAMLSLLDNTRCNRPSLP
ncbi:MAG TPA: LysR family transcriptional regulator [Gammaproteobacteria bacterium]|nr:LysR family transcriptional regulator [Gammaproteobacteria bacterium]